MAQNDDGSRRIHPRLRILQNGARDVNVLRAIASPTVATSLSVAQTKVLSSAVQDYCQYREAVAADSLRMPRHSRLRKAPKLASQPKPVTTFVNVLIEVQRDRGVDSRARQQSTLDRIRAISERVTKNLKGADQRRLGGRMLVRRNFVSATIPVSALDELQNLPGIAFVHRSEPLSFSKPKLQPRLNNAPPSRVIGEPAVRQLHSDGSGVIVGIIDVGGFDFAHADFGDANGGTRFSSIWDQGGDFRSPPGARAGSDIILEVSVVDMQRSDPIAHQMAHFGKVVRGEAQPLVSAFDGMQNLKITEAIVLSSKTGQVVQTG